MKVRSFLQGALIACAIPSLAPAAIVSYSQTASDGAEGFSDGGEIAGGFFDAFLFFDAFDTSLGTFVSATFDITASMEVFGEWVADDFIPDGLPSSYETFAGVRLVTPPGFEADASASASSPFTEVEAGTSSDFDYAAVLDTTLISTAPAAATGTGGGFFDVETLHVFDGFGEFGFFFSGYDARVEATLTYSYDDGTPTPPAIPLPAGAPLLIAGLGALAMMRRRKA
ncbi:VPLPA-CTERM sorting domain-containing protein [Litoreibacter roseus]|uniref:VPLPA-CTERM protein sorting domain-containing protein n=1 Tax=Litoreibacter roseus TaxID=2601869 RepID=A0A6N6JJ35_9RHOB|nr:VPLPA-CTERM sorting domain-containing protein [Litoreibacter roseus]GFE65840.1 hypothetical protein KIN_29140 [Litoreibacter roseus]